MSQFVWSCGVCGWRGVTAALGRGRKCGACGSAVVAKVSERHPRVTRRCADCPTVFLSTSLAPVARCAKCRGRVASQRAWSTRQKKYDWTPARETYLRAHYDGKIKRRAEAIAARLGWPVYVIKHHAQVLGLCYPVDRRAFTPAEVAFIEEWTGSRASKWIAHRLKRSETSVVLKQKRMHLSRRVRDGYTVAAVSEAFGVDHHSVDRWIREGALRAGRRGTARADKQGDIYKITEPDLKAFVRNHPTAFRLDKVDQVWFLDLILGAPATPVDSRRDRPVHLEEAS